MKMKQPKSIRPFVKGLDVLRTNIRLIILFGSAARNEWKKNSDIDLLIVVKRLSENVHDEILTMADKAMAATGYEELLAPHIISEKHFDIIKKNKTDFYDTISSEGRNLWKA